MARCTSVYLSHIYQVWGIVSSFILLWVRHNLQIDKRNRLHAFFLPITHRSGVDTVQYDCAMKIQNLCVHQTNGVTDYYSAELVGNKQHLSVKFFINAGGGGIVAYNSNDDLIYQVQSINGIRNIDISTWRNGDEIELCPQQGIKRDN